MDQDPHSNSLGIWLSAQRRRRGASLAELAAQTRIRQSYLLALEEENFDFLPGEAYRTGFLRLYATALGLAPTEAVERYRRLVGPRSEEEAAAVIAPVLPRTAIPRRYWLRLGLLLALISLGLVVVLVLPRGQNPSIAAVTEAPPTQIDTAVAAPPQSVDEKEPGPAVAVHVPPPAQASGPDSGAVEPGGECRLSLPAGGGSLKVEALAACRIQVVVDARPPRDYQLPAGAALKWPIQTSLTLTMIESGRLRCWLDGRLLTILDRQNLILQSPSTRE